VTLAPSIPITAAPIPTDVADGTNTYCGTYYEAIVGDYCNLIVMKFAISLQDFVFLNPAINANCTNLFAEESYCVRPVGDSKFLVLPVFGGCLVIARKDQADLATSSKYLQWKTRIPIHHHFPNKYYWGSSNTSPSCALELAYGHNDANADCD